MAIRPELFERLNYRIVRPAANRQSARRGGAGARVRPLRAPPPCYVEADTGADPQKAGALPADADRFVEPCRREYVLLIAGPMGLPPLGADPAAAFRSEEDKERNDEIAVVRSGVERAFAVHKRCHGLERTRFLGLAKKTTFYGLAAIAPDIRKGAMFLRLYGLAQPAGVG